MITEVTIYFVLLGLHDGDRDVQAIPCGGGNDPPQADGWYWMADDMVDGIGPFPSRQDAREAGLKGLDQNQKPVELAS